MNYERAYLVVTAETDPAKQYAEISSDNYHEMKFTSKDKAKWYAPSAAIRRVEVVYNGADAGKPMPQILLSLQALFEDGTPVSGQPAPRYIAPARKTAQIPNLPEIPPVVKLSDETWRVVPQMDLKHSPNGQYFAIPFSFLYKRAPISGYFTAPTKRDLFDAIFDTRNDAIADGRGGWLNPQNPQTPAEPTREQLYRTTQLSIADAAEVQKWLNLVASRNAAIAAAEVELYREPTEAEIEAVDARSETIARMPADVYKARYLSDKAFRIKCDRREMFEKKMKEKEQKEQAAAADRAAIDHGRKVLADRERGVVSER